MTVLLWLGAPTLAAADKDDVVEFGINRLIGEIKGVTRLATKQTIRVTRSDGALFPAPELRFRTFSGIGFNEERFDGAGSRSSIESIFGATVDWYRSSEPELDSSSRLTTFASLTDPGRMRSHLVLSARWELYRDLFWHVTLYDEYDSDPQGNPNEAEPTSENYGMSTGLGWSW